MVFVATRYHFVEGEALGLRWIRLRERLGASETTLKAYASDLNDYLRWCSSHDRPPYPLALDGIADYVRDLRDRKARRGQRQSFGRNIGLPPTTVYRRITTLRQWFDYLVDIEAVERNPFTRESSRFGNRIGLVRRAVNTPWLPNDRDWQPIIDLVASDSRRNRLMFLLSYECAWRRAELSSLSLSDIDHAQRKVAIRATKSKSRLDRWSPISKETAALLIAYERCLPPAMSSTEEGGRDGDVLAMQSSDDQSWSVNKAPAAGTPFESLLTMYPTFAAITASDGSQRASVPAVLKFKINIKAGTVLHSEGSLALDIKTQQPVKAGDSVAVLFFSDKSILSVEAADTAKAPREAKPWFAAFPSGMKAEFRRDAVEAWQIEKAHS